MQEFTKKQIKGIIDILKSEPTTGRPALQTMRICRDGYAYITNGYLAIRWKFETEPVPKDDIQEDFVIPLENLVRWYKLANSNDRLNEITIIELQDTENTTKFPNMCVLFNVKMLNKSDNISMDLNLMEQVNKCTNCRNYFGYDITIFTDRMYMLERKRKNIEVLIMGLR